MRSHPLTHPTIFHNRIFMPGSLSTLNGATIHNSKWIKQIHHASQTPSSVPKCDFLPIMHCSTTRSKSFNPNGTLTQNTAWKQEGRACSPACCEHRPSQGWHQPQHWSVQRVGTHQQPLRSRKLWAAYGTRRTQAGALRSKAINHNISILCDKVVKMTRVWPSGKFS